MSNNKTLKVFSSTAVAGMIAAAMMSSQAFAAVDAYSVKVGDQVYKYDKVQLEKAFLDSKAGEKSALYEDFTKKLGEAKGFYAFNDTKNGYVDYSSIEAKFLEAKGAAQKFDVDAFTESKDAKIVKVSAVKKAVVNKDGKVEYVDENNNNDETEGVKIKSVTPLNLKQVKIEFAQKVEDTDKKNDIEDKDNYTLKDSDNDEVDEVIKEVKLDESKKFAILTFKDKVDPDNENNFIIQNREKYTLIVDEDVTGDEVKEKLSFSDTELPTVQGLEVVGKDTIKVKFSEPIKPWNLKDISDEYKKDEKSNNVAAILDKDDFDVKDVKGGDLSISKVELVNDGKEANIVVGTDFENKQELSVKVKATVKDYAGLAVISDTKNVTVKEDTKIPEVVDYKNVESDEVTLIFNKDIKFKDTDANIIDKDNNSSDLDKFYHTNDSNTPYKVKVDGKELTMYFESGRELPPDSAIMYIKSGVLESRWEVENEKISHKVKRDNDTVKPEVNKVSQEKDYNNKIRVKFSEKVKCGDGKNDSSALKTGNYTIKDDKGKEWKVSDVKQDGSSEKEFILTTTKDLDADLKYELTVENVEDKAGNAIKKVTKNFKVTDNDPVKEEDVKVTVYSAGTSDQKIVIDFDSKMKTDESKYSIKDLTKYTLVSDKKTAFDGKQSITLDNLYKSTIKTVKDGNAVEISVPCSHDDGKRKDKEFDLSKVGTLTMQIARVADNAGNVTERNFEISGSQFTTREKYNEAIDFDKDEDFRPQIISPEDIFFGFDDKVNFDINDIKVVAATSEEAAEAMANGQKVKDGKAELLNIANNKTGSNDGNTTVRLTINKSLNDKRYDDDDYNHIFTYDGKRILEDGTKADVYVVVVPTKTKDGNRVTATKNDYDETVVLGAVKLEDKIAPTIVDNDKRSKTGKYLGNDVYGTSENNDEAVEYRYNAKDNTGSLVLTFEEDIDPESVSTTSVTLNKDDFKDAKVKSVKAVENKVTIDLYNLVDETKDNEKVKIEEGHEILLHGIKDEHNNEGKELKLQVGDFKELKGEEVVNPEKPAEKPEKPAEKPEKPAEKPEKPAEGVKIDFEVVKRLASPAPGTDIVVLKLKDVDASKYDVLINGKKAQYSDKNKTFGGLIDSTVKDVDDSIIKVVLKNN